MPPRWINRPCLLILREFSASTDDYGNEVPTERGVETVCEIQQRLRQEPGQPGDLSETTWDGFFPAGTKLNSGDAVSVDGLGGFEVIADPWAARNPRTQIESHLEATLKRTRGPEDGS
jgi:hypothetical protein